MLPVLRCLKRYFYPRSPCGERHECWTALNHPSRFLSTLSLRRATLLFHAACFALPISIHALLAESDKQIIDLKAIDKQFLSTLSLRRATGKVRVVEPGLLFLSTLSLRRATLFGALCWLIIKNFYPRSPCGERLNKIPNQCKIDKFLSTLSLRRATTFSRFLVCGSNNFYPRSPCGERPCIMTTTICTALFLSTLSLRRATLLVSAFTDCAAYFYPRSPCGERRRNISLLDIT